MKLYVTRLGRWAGTQVDARIAAKDDDGKYRVVEVPTDKPSLIAWLNGYREAVLEDLAPKPAPLSDDDISDLLGDDEPAVEEILSAKVVTPAPRISTTQDVIDWVLDVATPPQIEGLFASLGARFHEANKGKNND